MRPPKAITRLPLRVSLTVKNVTIGLVIVLVLAAVALITLHHFRAANKPDSLPTSVVKHVKGFQVYAYTPPDAAGFLLNQKSVQFQSGVLVFQLTNPNNKTLAVTEEKIPDGYDYANLRADKEFDAPIGHAFITDGVNRTTAAVFTTDKTWILINAPSPIGTDAMTTVLNSFIKQPR